MYVTELEKRGLTVNDFKRKYPRIFSLILQTYGGRENIFDVHAAINLFLLNYTAPVCDICKKHLAITKKYKTAPNTWVNRCSEHINTHNIIDKSQILLFASAKGVNVSGIPENVTKTDRINIECPRHGMYTQTVGNFLAGTQCRRCYHDKPRPRITVEQWIKNCNAIHKNKYTYIPNDFKSVTSNTAIICPEHGKFVQHAGVHMRGHGCPACATASVTEKLRISNDEFIQKCRAKHGERYDYSKTEYVSILHSKIKIICKTHGEFEQRPGDHLNGGHGCPKCGSAQASFKSKAEYEIIEFLKSEGIENIEHSWQGLGVEIDIYLPDFKTGIEYNGVYWHSSAEIATDKKFETQHVKKTNLCEKNGIQLFHILDLEWDDPIKKEIWKSTLLHKLGLTKTKLYARNCQLVIVDANLAKSFFQENHLQGYASGRLNIGLQHNGKLVACGSFVNSRFRKNETPQYELLRFASILNTSIVGGFSKILKEFGRTHSGTLVSYANRRWSKGNVYNQANFKLVKVGGPCYYYTNCKQLWHRSVFQKHKLKDLLPKFDPTKTEVQNMYINNYRRIWDCGSLVFEIDIK